MWLLFCSLVMAAPSAWVGVGGPTLARVAPWFDGLGMRFIDLHLWGGWKFVQGRFSLTADMTYYPVKTRSNPEDDDTLLFSLIPGFRFGKDQGLWASVGGGFFVWGFPDKIVNEHTSDFIVFPTGSFSLGYLFGPTEHLRHGPELVLGSTITLQYTVEWGRTWVAPLPLPLARAR